MIGDIRRTRCEPEVFDVAIPRSRVSFAVSSARHWRSQMIRFVAVRRRRSIRLQGGLYL